VNNHARQVHSFCLVRAKTILEDYVMTNGLQKCLLVLLVLALSSLTAFSQGGASTGSIAGTVLDPKGAVVAGATITIRSVATNQESTTQTSGEGTFSVPALAAGVYTATVTAAGFKQSVVTEIKVDVGAPTTLRVELEIGSANETVTVVGGAELLQSQSATIGTTLIGRQITDLPNASRDALDLVLTMPGTATPGRPRTSTVNGLPKGALNITLDGLNAQDNLLKSSDGFFTFIRPRTDAIGEVTVSTSSPGSESSSEGAIQIKFVTANGTNDYHGGLYWYHRNPAINANYWFNNRDQVADPVTHKAPQARILLNQPGGKVGGPISIPGLFSGKDKAFFFVNYEEYRLPERTSRTRTLLTTEQQGGLFRYEVAAVASPPAGCTTAGATPGLMRCERNLYTLAAAAGFPSTPDPTIGSVLSQIRSSVSGLNLRPIDVAAGSPQDLNRQQVSFINPGGQTRRFPTVRFDFNPTNKHHIENIWNYQVFGSVVDFLNNVDPAFPNFPNHGSQTSLRWSNVTALRSTLTNNVVNEARFGLNGGIVLFFGEVNAGQFANQGGLNLGLGAANVTSATVTAAPSRRNAPTKQFHDTLSWNRGNHTWTFGFDFTRINLFSQAFTRVVPSLAFGVDTTLDATLFNSVFSAANFPGASAGTRGAAANTYALLTGRTTTWNYTGVTDEAGKYVINGDLIQRMHVSEYGFYAQDTWRIRPNVTLTLGLRNEAMLPYVAENSNWSFASYDAIWGVSGPGNLFKPGTMTGSASKVTKLQGSGNEVFKPQRWNLLPTFGFTWAPNWKSGFLSKLAGSSGQTVVRGGFSMASVREGVNVFLNVTGSNPGPTFTSTRSISLTGANNLPVGTLLRNGTVSASSNTPSSVSYPFTVGVSDSVNAFDPNLKLGYVESFTFGIQRELTKDMVMEVRYVGNRGHRLWRQTDLNEVNTLENGFSKEFVLAQQNLIANINAGRGLNFRYFGAGTGTSPLPILLANFSGVPMANAGACGGAGQPTCATLYASTLFANATFVSNLHPFAPSATAFAGTLSNFANNSLFRPNRDAAGLPANFFRVNPDVLGDPFLVDNGTQTWYDAFQIEFRRRMSKGLLLQGNYVFSKSMSNFYASSSAVAKNYFSMHNVGLDKGRGPYDITHSFKTNFIYELPFGRGQRWLGDSHGLVNGFLGGWGFNGSIRIQSGNPVNFGNVQLVGMTREELGDMIEVRKGNTSVFYLPEDVITNTSRAFAVSYNAANQPIYTNGAPTGRYIAPATAANCIQAYTGQCGITNLVIKGPRFVRPDLSVVKRIKFTESNNLELRAEFLNAFNAPNFLIGSAANDLNGAPLNGIITAAYQDTSTTNDPGGRLVQLVIRWNF
jgi:hypothetical protein